MKDIFEQTSNSNKSGFQKSADQIGNFNRYSKNVRAKDLVSAIDKSKFTAGELSASFTPALSHEVKANMQKIYNKYAAKSSRSRK